MLSNLLWARNLIASCFSCFTMNILQGFRVMAFARERSRLAPLKAISNRQSNTTGKCCDVNSSSDHCQCNQFCVYDTSYCIELFHFFGNFFTNINFIKNRCLNFDMIVVLAVPYGLNLDKFWFHCRICPFFI